METSGRLGVIGWPIGHSLSPAMQGAALAAAGLDDWTYIKMSVAPGDLETAVHGLRALGFAGFNVTIPHKATIMPLMDEVDDNAKAVGAVNTVAIVGGKLIGHNTDVVGFRRGLRGHGLAGRHAAICGAGGAARAVVVGLLQEGVAGITIGARNIEHGRALASQFVNASLNVVDWSSDSFAAALSQAAIVVNATPLGMSPNIDAEPPVDWDAVNPEALCYDLIYTPAETKFLRRAHERGHVAVNGEAMLVGQGAAAFKLWTGVEPDAGVMAAALREQLQAADAR